MMHERTHLDLFSGIGGFALACRIAGERTGARIRTVAFCEQEPYAQAVLRKHWPDAPIFDDVCQFDGKPYRGKCWLLTGGFPCQPFSVAGQRRGEADDRALWPEMLRVIAEARPAWVLGENVDGFVSLGLDRCLSDLEAAGYEVWPVVIPACAVDAPHRRDRVWIVAHSKSERWGARRNGWGEAAGSGTHAESHRPSQNPLAVANADDRLRHEPDKELRTRRDTANGCGSSCDTNPEYAPNPDGEQARRPAKSRGECCEWEPEPAVGRVANGIPNRMDRLRGLGNAIVPQVAAEIIEAMIQSELP